MKLQNTFFTFAFLILFGSGCQNSTITTPSVLFGDIRGVVQLRDSSGYPIDEHSGVTVSLEGTRFSGFTDTNGVWIIRNVPTGNYTISFEKPHFATEKIIGHQHVGNGTDFIDLQDMYSLLDLNMMFVLSAFYDDIYVRYRDSTYQDSNGVSQRISINDTIWYYPNGAASFRFFTHPKVSGSRTIAVIYGKDSNITILNPDSYIKIDLSRVQDGGIDPSENTYWENIAVRNFIPLGFSYGDKVYCRGYMGGPNAQKSIYLDKKTGKPVYTAFNNFSSAKSFFLPPK